ncbi:hypothetical protein MRB53_037204 [Persea americana]|nr:hypothetical protein MRB53_037204 [Persea americana]
MGFPPFPASKKEICVRARLFLFNCARVLICGSELWDGCDIVVFEVVLFAVERKSLARRLALWCVVRCFAEVLCVEERVFFALSSVLLR